MKKALLIVAIAAILICAFAGTALAAVNRSGQQYVGAAPAPSLIATQGQSTNIYLDWSTGLGDNGNPLIAGNSPHGNYATTTVKCAVCHSVHYAAPGNAPVANGAFNNGLQTADTLLRMRADQACDFCHATAGMAVNGMPVYDGVAPAPGTATAGHVTGTNCSVCHTTVHGVGEDNSVASLAGFLLRTMPSNIAVGAYGTTANMITAIDAIDTNAQAQGFYPGQALGAQTSDYASISTPTLREQAVGIFCAECHAGSYAQVAAGASTNVQDWNMATTDPLGSGPFSGHRIAASATTTWNAASDVSSGNTTLGSVAWLPATNCISCHATNDIYGNTAFPHSWGGSKMWLLSAADAGSATTTLPINGDPATGPDPTRPQMADGVCLRCHVQSGSGAGIGITF